MASRAYIVYETNEAERMCFELQINGCAQRRGKI